MEASVMVKGPPKKPRLRGVEVERLTSFTRTPKSIGFLGSSFGHYEAQAKRLATLARYRKAGKNQGTDTFELALLEKAREERERLRRTFIAERMGTLEGSELSRAEIISGDVTLSVAERV